MMKWHYPSLACLIAVCLLSGLSMRQALADERPVPFDSKGGNEPPAQVEKKGCLQDSSCLPITGSLGFDVIFNNKDVFLGVSYEQPLVQKDIFELNAGIFWYGRPFRKTSFEQTGPNTYNQYKEHRFLTGAKLTEKIWLGDALGFFGGAGYGYTYGSFEGTERPTRDRWTPHYFGGAFVSIAKILNLEAGYQYTKIPHSPDHFIFTSISVNFFNLLTSAPGAPGDDKKIPSSETKSKPGVNE